MCSQVTVETCCLAGQVSNFKRSKDPRAGNATGSSSSSSTSACGRMITDRHRARCRSSASTSDEHVSLCASRAGRQRARQLRFRSDGYHLVYRTLQRRPGERAAFLRCAATASSARALSRYFLEGTTTYTPHVCDQHFDLRRPRSSPLPGARLRIIRAELTIGAKAVRSWQASHAR